MTARQTAIEAIANHQVASTQDYLEHAGADIYGHYVFGEDAAQAVNLKSLRFEFNDSPEAALHLDLQALKQTWLIGLDGTYRLNADAQAVRGYWADPQTFIMDVFGETSYQFRFIGDRLTLGSPGGTGGLEARQQTP